MQPEITESEILLYDGPVSVYSGEYEEIQGQPVCSAKTFASTGAQKINIIITAYRLNAVKTVKCEQRSTQFEEVSPTVNNAIKCNQR
ncbi:hypothetical protein M514_28187 [Trichuris suis]|uniref:Uncharacterized protein n=1 Tax=Trichuris suis TaxID=68888 RepID=A0A085MQZ0_9BILA|nr:hypothetical protein M514_28187 [Trichuris suis]